MQRKISFQLIRKLFSMSNFIFIFRRTNKAFFYKLRLQEIDDLTLTPFEKNLEFWRQLWRVIEKSIVFFVFSNW